jgi:hypothetical protein
MIRNMFAVSAALLLALFSFAFFSNPANAEDPQCGLLTDCGFDNFYGDLGPCTRAWQCDNPGGIGLTPHEGWPKGPSLTFAGNAPFDRKVWQRVQVTPGKGYNFSVPFAVVNINGGGWHEGDQVNRRLGIDPFGGTDPNSSNIKWTGDFFGKAKVDDSLQIDEYARADFITVYIWVINPYSDKHVDVFVDTPSLIENSGMEPIQIAPPTAPARPTLLPPTAAPTRAPQPTAEPTRKPQPAQASAPTDEPVVEPTATRIEPTTVPRATQTRVAQAQPTTRPARTRVAVAQSSSPSDQEVPATNTALRFGMMGLFGLVGLSGAIVLVGAAAYLLLRRR